LLTADEGIIDWLNTILVSSSGQMKPPFYR